MPPGTYAFAVRAFNGRAQRTVKHGHADVSGILRGTANPAIFRVEGWQRDSVSWSPALNGAAPTGFTLIVTGTYSLDVPIAGRSLSSPVGPGTYTLSVAATNPCGTSAPTAAQTSRSLLKARRRSWMPRYCR